MQFRHAEKIKALSTVVWMRGGGGGWLGESKQVPFKRFRDYVGRDGRSGGG